MMEFKVSRAGDYIEANVDCDCGQHSYFKCRIGSSCCVSTAFCSRCGASFGNMLTDAGLVNACDRD